jgi:glycosyltransferase involved in cell wall biosynthesis
MSEDDPLAPLLGQAAADLLAGRLAAAEAGYRAVLAERPGPALHGLGLLAARAGRPDLAVPLLAQALAAWSSPEIRRHLGQARLDAGDAGGARPLLAQACVQDPAEPGTLEALGRALADRRWLERALALDAGFIAARLNLAVLRLKASDDAPARQELRRALALDPSSADGWFTLGVCGAGVFAYGRALALDPGRIDAAVNQARLSAQPSRAEPGLRRGLALWPAAAPALNELARLDPLDASAALRLFGRAHAAAADAALHSNWLQQHAYDPSLAQATILARHRDWARRHGGDAGRAAPRATPPAIPPATPLRRHDPDATEATEATEATKRRLRIGYVSADLGRHPVGFFLAPVLQHHDRGRFEVVCYSGRREVDEWTLRLRASCDGWVEAWALGDAALGARIGADTIDILVDLSGHTAGNRLPVFARRPAPLQLSWMGYPGTTGLAAIDHLLADAAQIPPGDERWYVEKVERLAPGYVCYAPPEDAPPVVPLPARGRGHVTFGSLNNLAKLNGAVLALWARVLAAVPGARLLLAWPSLADPEIRRRLYALAAGAGIVLDRLDLRTGGAHREFLSLYGEIDIALDPFPYSGGLTTVEALWMGVPVLTLPGERYASRHAASHLGQAGLDDWICADADAFVARAAAAAGDLEALAARRSRLRARLAASPLLDGAGFTRRLEQLYLELRNQKARNQKPEIR